MNADLVWIDELGIHITALEPKLAPIAPQPPLPGPDELRTLEMIANAIKAAADRGDFAAVTALAAEAKTLPATSEEAAAEPAEPAPIAAVLEPEAKIVRIEAENCRALIRRLILLL